MRIRSSELEGSQQSLVHPSSESPDLFRRARLKIIFVELLYDLYTHTAWQLIFFQDRGSLRTILLSTVGKPLSRLDDVFLYELLLQQALNKEMKDTPMIRCRPLNV